MFYQTYNILSKMKISSPYNTVIFTLDKLRAGHDAELHKWKKVIHVYCFSVVVLARVFCMISLISPKRGYELVNNNIKLSYFYHTA